LHDVVQINKRSDDENKVESRLGSANGSADGESLDVDELESQIDEEQSRHEGAILIAQLIGLLLTFIGDLARRA
jgi:hypothetical protein